jgi:Ribosome recycling factor
LLSTTKLGESGLSIAKYHRGQHLSQVARGTTKLHVFSRRRFHPECRTQEQEPRYSIGLDKSSIRAFANSARLGKKKDVKIEGATEGGDGTPVDVLDMSSLHGGIADALKRLKEDLTKLRAGGRLNAETIENLRVQLSKDPKESVRLGELAQVIPKGGRMLAILVGEENVSGPV